MLESWGILCFSICIRFFNLFKYLRRNTMRNLTLLTDLYQLTMLNGYFEKNIHEDEVVFDMK